MATRIKLERRLDSLYASPEAPQDTHCNLRGIPWFLLQLEKSSVFPTSFRDEGWFPYLDSRGTPTFPSNLMRRLVSLTASQEEPRGSCRKSEGHQVPPQLEISPDSPAGTRMEHWVSPHNTKGGLTPLENAWIPFLNVTPLLHLETKAEFHASIRDEVWHPFYNSRGK